MVALSRRPRPTGPSVHTPPPARRLVVSGLLLFAVSACGSDTPRSAAVPKQQVLFPDANFSSVLCPPAHVLANCFSGTGAATIAPLGKVALARTVVSGDQKRSAPD